MLRAVVWKNLLATMAPDLLTRTPAFSRPQSVRGVEPVARTTESTRTALFPSFPRKITRLASPSCSRAITFELVITIIPRSFVK